MTITFTWRGELESAEVNALHVEAFDHPAFADDDWDWTTQLERHSLGWVSAREVGVLVGFVIVGWDGLVHARRRLDA
jgi:hypothetical protein